jgi:hypothetical protein
LFRAVPTIKNKEIEDSFQNNMNYKKFSNKFELPKVISKVPMILKRKMDVSPYDRVIYFLIIIIFI